jgi:hypothetical protein
MIEWMQMTDMLMEQARCALRDGHKEDAQALLVSIIVDEPERDEAWLLLAEALADPGKKRQCLERARNINPGNRAILRALDQLASAAMPAQDARPAASEERTRLAPAEPPREQNHAPGDEIEPLLEWGERLGRTLMMTVEPGDTRQVGAELLRVLDRATWRDPVRARRWARSCGREPLWKFEKVLSGTISSLSRDDPDLAELRVLRQRALGFLG